MKISSGTVIRVSRYHKVGGIYSIMLLKKALYETDQKISIQLYNDSIVEAQQRKASCLI